MLYAVDLFCGAGGCSEGLIQAGFHILFSSDISDMVEVTYTNRHRQLGLVQGVNTWFERADIRDLTGERIRKCISSLKMFENREIPDIDVVFGGPSCQGFSRIGRRDKSDPRNILFGEYVRVISEIKPKYAVLENVEGFMDMQFTNYRGITGLKYPDGSITPAILMNELREIGYETVLPRVLNAADYGVPQRRNRVIFVAYRKGLKAPEYPKPLSTPDRYISIRNAIGDLIGDKAVRDRVNPELTEFQKQSIEGRTPDINGRPVKLEGGYRNTELTKVSDVVSERFSLFRQGENNALLRKRVGEQGVNISDKPSLVRFCAEHLGMGESSVIDMFGRPNAPESAVDVLLTRKNIRQRFHEDSLSATVLTIADDYISPWEPRTFSVREMARLQSFDDSFEFLGKRTTGGLKRRVEIPQYTQVGNAVPPLLAKAVAEEIRKVLES